MIPPVEGILETALYVADLDRSAAFYREVFGFEQIYEEGDRMRAFSVRGRQVLLLFKQGMSTQGAEAHNGRIPPHDGSGTLHLAFAIAASELQHWRERLNELGVPIESEVHCGGDSVYLRDPDRHLIELITPGCWPVY
jgi:catechol 2,3-dioxygenase-like lactoylglutathione lyase family enzyme